MIYILFLFLLSFSSSLAENKTLPCSFLRIHDKDEVGPIFTFGVNLTEVSSVANLTFHSNVFDSTVFTFFTLSDGPTYITLTTVSPGDTVTSSGYLSTYTGPIPIADGEYNMTLDYSNVRSDPVASATIYGLQFRTATPPVVFLTKDTFFSSGTPFVIEFLAIVNVSRTYVSSIVMASETFSAKFGKVVYGLNRIDFSNVLPNDVNYTMTVTYKDILDNPVSVSYLTNITVFFVAEKPVTSSSPDIGFSWTLFGVMIATGVVGSAILSLALKWLYSCWKSTRSVKYASV